MASFPDLLSPLQRALIERFFADPTELRLTGGAALAGYHLGHRRSHDVDLFGPADADLESAGRRIESIALALGARATKLRTSPHFVRWLVQGESDACEVDVVRDPTPQVDAPLIVGAVRVDSPREIAANKVAALVSRSEVRDLVDLRHLERSGVHIEQAFRDAVLKDAGVSPDTLALFTSWIPVEEASRLIGANEDVDELRRFRDDLVRRFRAVAFPGLR